jgi:hypothetical protein
MMKNKTGVVIKSQTVCTICFTCVMYIFIVLGQIRSQTSTSNDVLIQILINVRQTFMERRG